MDDHTIKIVEMCSNLARTVATWGIFTVLAYRGWIHYREYRETRHEKGKPTEEETT